MDALSIGEISMINDLRQLEITGHNLANVNTTGYKRQQPVFHSFFEQLEQAAADQLSPGAPHRGKAVPGLASINDLSPGAMRRTGNPLDLAISGEGYFEVNTPAGVRYTRDGAFELDNRSRLVTGDGHPVMSLNGEVRLVNENPEIDQTGRIWNGDELLGQIKLVRFEGDALKNHGSGLFSSEGARGQELMDGMLVRQGQLESANVDAAKEMIRAISTVRHIETTQRVMKYYDQMLGEAISTIAEF